MKKIPFQSWWELWPDLFAEELHAFQRNAIDHKIVLQRKDILIIEANWSIPDQPPLRLRIGFSSLHPFFPPIVAAPHAQFERHQHLIGKTLCLLTQETGQWNSAQRVADFIEERLRQLLEVLTARTEGRWEDAANLEERTGDPLMPYFAGSAEDDSLILFDGQSVLPPEGHGSLELLVWSRPTPRNELAIEGVLHRVTNASGRLFGNAFSLPTNPPGGRRVTGRWVRLAPPPTDDPAELIAAADAELAKQGVLQARSVQAVNDALDPSFSVTAFVFPEEVEYGRKQSGTGWLFVVQRRSFGSQGGGVSNAALIRGERASEPDFFSRVPVANALRSKNVIVFGCGAIGSFVSLELARSGVGHLSLFDRDIVQPGNSVRWPLGRPAWGSNKAAALGRYIEANFPWTRATAYDGEIGVAATDDAKVVNELRQQSGPFAKILEIIDAVDLVIDTSASSEVQHALEYLCRWRRKPYVLGHATLGLAGGVVARFEPDGGGCWSCLQNHWHDGSVPQPPVDKEGVTTPAGCSAPTFTGGGFDVQEVSLEVVRSAIGLLVSDVYDPGDWSISILRLRDDLGRRVLPSWTHHECPPHPRCCGSKQ